MPILATDNRQSAREEVWKLVEWVPAPPHPSGADQRPVMECDARLIAISGGEGSGKSECTAMRAMEYIDISQLIWIVGQEYLNARKEFEYIAKWCLSLGYCREADVSFPKEGQCTLKTFTGCTIVTVSAKDIIKLGRESPDLILVCEAAQITFQAYIRLRGRITRNRGDMILSGTLEGCLVGDTFVATSRGIKQLKDVNCLDTVQGLSGNGYVSSTFNNGIKKTVKLKLDKGFEIEGTLDHKIITRLHDGSVVWKELDQVTKKDLVAIRYGCNLWGDRKIESELSYLAGLYIAEGCCSNDGRFTITSGCKEIQKYLIDSDFHPQNDGKGFHYRKTDHELVKSFKDIGLNLRLKARDKEVPFAILEADKESVVAFLQGLFDGDGSAYPKGIFYYTSSLKLAKQVQFLLLNLGIISSLSSRICKSFGKIFPKSYIVTICDPTEFMKIVGFRFNAKRNIEGNKLVKPRYLRNQANAGTRFLEYPVCWVRLQSKEYGIAGTYDITVDNGHAYWANGLIVHNSLGWWPELLSKWSGPNREGGKTFFLPTWANTIKYPVGDYTLKMADGTIVENVCAEIDDLFFNSDTPADVAMERYAGKLVKPAGIIFPEFDNETHVRTDLEYDPEHPVDIAVDPGYGIPGACCIHAIQYIEGQFRVVDEIYIQHLTLEEVIDKMQRDYPWGKAWAKGAIDVSGKSHHQGMIAPIDVFKKRTGITLRCKKVDVEGGIELLRGLLLPDVRTGIPKIVYSHKCKGVIAEMGGGKSPVPTGGPWKRNPATNMPESRNDHGCKCDIYYLVSVMGYTINKRASNYGKLFISKGRQGRLVELSTWEGKHAYSV